MRVAVYVDVCVRLAQFGPPFVASPSKGTPSTYSRPCAGRAGPAVQRRLRPPRAAGEQAAPVGRDARAEAGGAVHGEPVRRALLERPGGEHGAAGGGDGDGLG